MTVTSTSPSRLRDSHVHVIAASTLPWLWRLRLRHSHVRVYLTVASTWPYFHHRCVYLALLSSPMRLRASPCMISIHQCIYQCPATAQYIYMYTLMYWYIMRTQCHTHTHTASWNNLISSNSTKLWSDQMLSRACWHQTWFNANYKYINTWRMHACIHAYFLWSEVNCKFINTQDIIWYVNTSIYTRILLRALSCTKHQLVYQYMHIYQRIHINQYPLLLCFAVCHETHQT